MQRPPHESAYVVALEAHPRLCLAFFGVQFHTEEGQRLYSDSGILDAVLPALERAEGLLHNRLLMSDEGPVLVQYWRSEDDLNAFARQMPHTDWWRWLVENAGKGVSFYHEIYRIRAGEAIYEVGALPVGPAAFCETRPVRSGEGKSRERQAQFEAAQDALPEARP